ncbi:choice-of-anchor U domain-containing protein [Haliea sp.]
MEIAAKFGDDLPAGAKAYKRSVSGEWTPITGAVITGNTISYSITDGGPLDADGLVNGSITDPVTAVVPFAESIATLPPWACVLCCWSARCLSLDLALRLGGE